MENNIPTAEELFIKHNPQDGTLPDWSKQLMIEFAKIHVQAALEEAAQNSTVDICDWEPLTDMAREAEVLPVYGVDESSIRNAYPLNNIK